MALPSADEQWMLELVNRIRVDPDGELGRLLTSLNPLTAVDPEVQSALDYFGVDSTALQQNFAALTAVQALAWNSGVNEAATGHNNLMISQNIQSHQLPGENSLLTRVQDTTPEFINSVGENVYLYGESIEYSHAGYVIDWGFTSTGIQQPAGHLLNMTSGDFNMAGIAVGTSQVGEVSSTQNFITTSDVGPFILGVAFDDSDGDGFYDAGEGLGGVTVSVNGISTTSWASGGYQIELLSGGTYTVTFSGGGLTSDISTTITVGSANRKIDLALLGNDDTEVLLVRDDGDFDGIDAVGGSTPTEPETPVTPPPTTGTEGTDASEILEMTEGNDTVFAFGGNDIVWGFAGADLIYGNTGTDLIYGNTGLDTLYGGRDTDTIYGGRQEDIVYGNLEDDIIYGNLEADLMYGGQGADIMYGGQGNDTLLGNRDFDILRGNLGDDFLIGGSGNDTLIGGSGADHFYISQDFDIAADFNGNEGDRVAVTGSGVSIQGNSQSVTLIGDTGSIMIEGIGFDQFDSDNWIVFV